MANPGVGGKFVSVNLNKSYVQSPSGNVGFSGGSRVRPSNHRGSNGGGGGMVVLSRVRNSVSGGQKSGAKLSVPPPLNLPSLRKEHERLDSSSSINGGNARPGSGHGSSGMGWTKPGIPVLQEKESSGDQRVGSPGESRDYMMYSNIDGGARGSSIYLPPSARSGTGGQRVLASVHATPAVERAVLLKGEDFPSLQATLPTKSAPAQRQKDFLHQLKPSEEVSGEKEARSDSFRMRPQMHLSRHSFGNSLDERKGSSHGLGGVEGQSRKQDGYLPGPLPVVRLSHTLDWADDERDTGHRERDHGFSRTEAIRESDFDIPRGGMPRAMVHDISDEREVLRGDPYGRDLRTPSREGRDGTSWRVSSFQKNGFSAHEVGVDRNVIGARSFSLNREMNKDNKYGDSPYRDSARNGFSSTVNGAQDSRYIKRESGYGSAGQNGTHFADIGRAGEHNMGGRYHDLSNRYKKDVLQSNFMPKTSFSFGSKGLPVNDPILNFGRDKRLFSNSAKPYTEDPFVKDFVASPGFDGRDPFGEGLVGDIQFFQRRKDVLKHEDFRDPVRESFEAELERVQKMQEQERQHIAEEQARALELAQREEEERQRLVREDEEQRRRLEEEEREAAWRAEQERIEAVKRAEEQRIAREEEKRKAFLEEERRKEAAKQKLLELEARIARRQGEITKDEKFATVVGDERIPTTVRETNIPGVADVGDWEDGERMVERITNSDTLSRPHSFRDVFENGNGSTFLLQDQDNGYSSPRRDAFGGGKVFPRKEYYGGPGVMPSRMAYQGGVSEPHILDDFPRLKGQRWNLSRDSDHYSRNSEFDSEFPDNPMDKFGDIGWGQSRSRVSPHAPYGERLFQNSEVDGYSSFGRSRHSMRQPRVLPPPSVTSMHKISLRGDIEGTGSSAFLDGDTRYRHAERKNEHIMQVGYDGGYQEKLSEKNTEKTTEKNTPRCDSQSSLSVSSPPSSPTHLSHDDLDDPRDSPLLPVHNDGEQIDLSDNERVLSTLEADNNEDEEWAIDNNEELQEQEEYDDEEEERYQEEEEAHQVDDERFEGLHTEEETVTSKMGQLVLGFDEGVEVGIPSADEFERTPRNGKKTNEIQLGSVGIAAKPESFDGLVSNGHGLKAQNNFSEVTMGSSSKIICEKAMQESVEASNSSGMPSHQPITSSVNLPLTMDEVPPVKLQFGLFSGPPLIPSPVPAIQIGSIQMPLHLHHQGIFPFPPQTMSFVQPTVPAHYSLGQAPGGSLHNQGSQGSSLQCPCPKGKVSQENSSKELNALPLTNSAGNKVLPSQSGAESSLIGEKKTRPELISQVSGQGRHDRNVKRNYRSLANNGDTEAQAFSSERGFVGSKAPGTMSGGKGKRFTYTVRNTGSRSFPVSEASNMESNSFQRRARQNIRRTEFRVRESVDRRQSDILNKSTKPMAESEIILTSSHNSLIVDSESKMDKSLGKESPSKRLISMVKNNGSSLEDIDAPLQSGVVRVFKQPGIEIPSDEEDFIAVRSKRQMLNDRREQRAKEIKAKSRIMKAPRKPHSMPQTIVVSPNSKKVPIPLGGEMVHGIHNEAATIASPPLPPIGTPAVNMDAQADILSMKSLQTSSVPVLVPALSFETKIAVLDDVPTSLSSWGNVHTSQQVMSLTQTQLDEAMKPARFDTHVDPISDHSSFVLETGKPSASILPHDKSFSSLASPLNSLFVGERIQFGAVTSPIVLPPISRTISNGNGPPGSCRSDVSMDHKFSAPRGDCTMFFDKEKQSDKSCVHLEDPEAEAEAEAAASAVAVAAISSDDLVGNRLGSTPVSASDTKSFGADVTELPLGLAGNGQLSSQSRGEEPLSVALPADLLLETPSLSLWPPLPSPHNPSGPMLSHLHGAPPPHFPCYEMNPMFGGPIFAFGPHDDSTSTQPQSQKNNTSSAGPLGAWQPCHSGVDSFYGPPNGFTGPFITPPGGIQGPQGPPHMVVYNHFAPVGQFGQVGLSFMGATYIPSGKPPDWKHTPVSSEMGISEGDMSNVNMVSGQRNPPGMPAPIQNLAPGSPFMPMPSPLAMFDTSPFQSPADIPVQARWSHLPPILHSVPPPMAPLQHLEGGLPSQFSHGLSVDSSCRFQESRSSLIPTDSSRNFCVTTESTTQFPDELGLVDPSSSANGNVKVQTISKCLSSNTAVNPSESGPVGNNNNSQRMSSAFRTQTAQQQNPSNQHYLHPIGYSDQRGGGVPQKIRSGGEWSHRRMGSQGRNQTSVADKNFVIPKVKQIYVPKPSTSETSATVCAEPCEGDRVQ
ncbi:uncharacterized protein LOC143858033 isoform X2 [Tasmannia lanceolata]|uniref:uncharacterized protein LOC143858033 isoform X2 n=1 Tax=Tasmannia lanceolata TaxID=3420 RepID=UPI004063FB82